MGEIQRGVVYRKGFEMSAGSFGILVILVVVAIMVRAAYSLGKNIEEDRLRKKISKQNDALMPCGHISANLIGDEYGHFTCRVCNGMMDYLSSAERIEDTRRELCRLAVIANMYELKVGIRFIQGMMEDKENGRL